MKSNIRFIIYINGIVTCALAAAMAIPLVVDLLFCDGSCVNVFTPSIFTCVFIGVLTILSCKNADPTITRKDAFLLVVSLWTVTSLISAFPFYIFQDVSLSFMSSLFEAASGITTTGATIYPDVEILPQAINVWRFILHFIGGVGIVAIGIIALPMMKVGGMQLFLTENQDKSQKFMPRVSQIMGFFFAMYVIVIGIFAVFLRLSGMSFFDSVCHSISAISTGGFSTKNAGISWFKSSEINIVISMAMFVGGITFLEIVKLIKNGSGVFLKNQQTRGYIKLVLFTSIVPVILSMIFGKAGASLESISAYIFNVISAITTTGFSFTKAYINPEVVLMTLAMIGGCSGSTAGGIKIFRLQILYSIIKNHINKITRPFDVTIPKYQGQKISNSLTISVVSFIALLIVVFVVSSTIISLMSTKSPLTCCYSVLSCLFNIGYDVDFASFQQGSKFILICDMIVGRLEIVPCFVILSKFFWRK